MTTERIGTCEWCGKVFVATNARGPIPKFCRRSHRQRAFEATRAATPTMSSVAPPPGDRSEAPAVLRDLLAHPIEAADAKRPTVLAPALVARLAAVDAVLRTVRYDPDDLDTLRLFVVAAGLVERLRTQQRVLVDHARSASKLARALAETNQIAEALLDPATAAKPARFPGGRLLRVAVPGPDRLLPQGVIEVDFDNSGHRRVRWYPDADTSHDGAALHRVARRRAEAHRFGDIDDWTNLARDLIVVCAGWITSPLPMPTSLDQRAASELGAQLMRQFRTGPWSITAEEIVSWLADCGFVSITSGTAIYNPALDTVQSQ